MCKQVSLGHFVTTLKYGKHESRQVSPATYWHWDMAQLQTGLSTLPRGKAGTQFTYKKISLCCHGVRQGNNRHTNRNSQAATCWYWDIACIQTVKHRHHALVLTYSMHANRLVLWATMRHGRHSRATTWQHRGMALMQTDELVSPQGSARTWCGCYVLAMGRDRCVNKHAQIVM